VLYADRVRPSPLAGEGDARSAADEGYYSTHYSLFATRPHSPSNPLTPQCPPDLIQDHRIVDGGWRGPFVVVGDFLHRAAQDFA